MNRVVVGIISREQEGKTGYLLVSSKRDFGQYTGYYYPPGGHVEEGEQSKAALIREIKEELGIEVLPTQKVIETPGDVPDQITEWWICQVKTKEITTQDGELKDIKWFSKEEIGDAQNIWPATKHFFEKYIVGIPAT